MSKRDIAVYGSLRTSFLACCIAVALVSEAILFTSDHMHRRVSNALADRPTETSLNPGRLLTGSTQSNRYLLELTFSNIQDSYYKPVEAQLLLNGEQRELTAYLKRHGIDARLPHLFATGNREHDELLLDKDLRLAESLYGKQPPVELREAALHGILDSLGDPYTTYLSPAEINHLEESLRGGDFGGIGVYIMQDPRTKHIVVDPIEDTPAYKMGIKLGDEIVSVNGTPANTLTLANVEHLIRGRVGTAVLLVVRSHASSRERTISVVRAHILVPSVHAKMEEGFEYVRLSDFGQTSGDEVRRALLSGKQHHARGYILDLRDNGGGLLDSAVQVSSLFIPEGTIVSTIDRSGSRDVKEALHTSIGVSPLVILVNQYTASASEITAGAVQDYKAGVLIGTRTFGKGVVQSIYSLGPENGALKITTARYVTPLGRDIHHKGINPDLIVQQPIEENIIDSPRDLQLLAAKDYLRRHSAPRVTSL